MLTMIVNEESLGLGLLVGKKKQFALFAICNVTVGSGKL